MTRGVTYLGMLDRVERAYGRLRPRPPPEPDRQQHSQPSRATDLQQTPSRNIVIAHPRMRAQRLPFFRKFGRGPLVYRRGSTRSNAPVSADGENKIAHYRSFVMKTQRILHDRLLRLSLTSAASSQTAASS